MAAPIIPCGALEPLRLMQERGLRHRATPRTKETTRLPNGEYVTVWTEGAPLCALFVVASSQIMEVAAARGVAASGVLKLPRGTQPVVGQYYTVTGSIIGVGTTWSRNLKVTADLSEDTERVVRRLLVVETVLD